MRQIINKLYNNKDMNIHQLEQKQEQGRQKLSLLKLLKIQNPPTIPDSFPPLPS